MVQNYQKGAFRKGAFRKGAFRPQVETCTSGTKKIDDVRERSFEESFVRLVNRSVLEIMA